MPSRRWRFRLQDILDAIARIQTYTQGMPFDQFRADRRTVDAVEWNFIVIGEAAGHIPQGVTERLPSVPWCEMRDMGNLVVRGYWGVELEMVWNTVQDDLPPLVPLLQAVLEAEGPHEG